ncbi:MAG: hypothetical protein VX610_07440 [SAR324 cluster bacterium]|nr:hypothetical protein [SAR324 cluster bacterium]
MPEGLPLDDVKRKLRVEQAVRDFLHVLDHHELDLEEGLVAWNMLGFTMFQDQLPDATHEEIQQRMMQYSQNLFNSAHPA